MLGFFCAFLKKLLRQSFSAIPLSIIPQFQKEDPAPRSAGCPSSVLIFGFGICRRAHNKWDIHSCQTKVRFLLVHRESVKSFSRTSKKVSIDLANETENRLLKSGKDKIQASTNNKQRFFLFSLNKVRTQGKTAKDFIFSFAVS